MFLTLCSLFEVSLDITYDFGWGLEELCTITHINIKRDDHSNCTPSSLSANNNVDFPSLFPDLVVTHNSAMPSSGFSHVNASLEADSEIFADMTLQCINQMLMAEDMDELLSHYQESSALVEAERSLNEAISEKYPLTYDRPTIYNDHFVQIPENGGNSYDSYSSESGLNTSSCNLGNPSLCDVKLQQPSPYADIVSTEKFSQPFLGSYEVSDCSNELGELMVNVLKVPNIFIESQVAGPFKRGTEEANKALPDSECSVIDLESNRLSSQEQNMKDNPEVKFEKHAKSDFSFEGFCGRKHLHQEELELEEGRNNKQSAVYSEDFEETEIFDEVLLCKTGVSGRASSTIEEWRKQILPPQERKKSQSKGLNGPRGRSRRKGKHDVVDLGTLLMTCAQSMAANDHRSTGELLKQIKQHCSPSGDSMERLAHYFTNAFEARLAGTGSQIYAALAMKRAAADLLKAYHLYTSFCPFKMISDFFANQTIINAVEDKSRLHIIDIGIFYGFQWPCLFNRLSSRPGGPPRLRITGIDPPQPGFRPLERLKDTGRRLADYADRFGIPFEFHPIPCKWENIQIEDIRFEEDEVLVVNCLYRLKYLLDETVVVDSPRNNFLSIIRKMKPDVFIHGIVNGSYNAPFFVTRFREALFHYSTLFDMIETNVPREHSERILLEKEIFGRESLNVIACEGLERVERPETYKQWQIRNVRAGFKQMPLNPNIMKKAIDKVRTSYHKDYLIDEDNQWLLQGWKGRIFYALSTWKP